MVKIITKNIRIPFGELKIGDTFEYFGNIYMKIHPMIFAVDYCGYDSENEIEEASENAIDVGNCIFKKMESDFIVNKVDLEITAIPCVAEPKE